MREIKFRGKAKDGKWRFGGYHNNDMGQAFIIIGSYPYKSVGWSFVPVANETVGQFTGLHDKNGDEIYEGDIVLHVSGEKSVVEYCVGCFHPYDCSDMSSSPGFDVVIGNIHEKSELLK